MAGKAQQQGQILPELPWAVRVSASVVVDMSQLHSWRRDQVEALMAGIAQVVSVGPKITEGGDG